MEGGTGREGERGIPILVCTLSPRGVPVCSPYLCVQVYACLVFVLLACELTSRSASSSHMLLATSSSVLTRHCFMHIADPSTWTYGLRVPSQLTLLLASCTSCRAAQSFYDNTYPIVCSS